MPQNHEIFLNHIENIFGEAQVIKKHECPRGGVPVSVFIYRDIPEKGMLTGVTYGLSCYPYPDWKLGRPEMILSIESTDIMWTWAAAYFCATFRGKRRFSYGDIFTTDCPLASDTQMDGLLVFAQSILDREVQSVELNDYRVHFSQFYPIYRSELELYGKIGLERFWKHEGFAMYDPKRPPIDG
jgi:hypothetical protein